MMDSPVEIPFKSFIVIDREKKEAVYLQVVYQFINAVRRNLFEDGDRLPGSRQLSKELNIHRKTVVAALSELQEQGWVRIIPNVGCFVSNPVDQTSSVQHKNYQTLEKARFSFKKEIILNPISSAAPVDLQFSDGHPDYRINKTEELIRFYTSVLRRKIKSGNDAEAIHGSAFFRDQLSFYLNLTRGIHISREFLLPVAGIEQLHSILAQLLIRPGDIVLVEEFSYFLPNMIFNKAGAIIKTVPLTAEGIDVDHIRHKFDLGEIRFLYLNPKCQYPTTTALSKERQGQLLQLAKDYNFIIIEDDTDFEFSYMRSKKDSLFKEDGGNHVIYLGAFCRFLNPGFQMNFLLAPKDFLQEAIKYLNIYGRSHVMMQQALAELIYQGDIHRYQRKSNKVVMERKTLFAGLLRQYLGDRISFEIPEAGLAFWIQINIPLSLMTLQCIAGSLGLSISSRCLYQTKATTSVRLGYAHLNGTEMEKAVHLLSQALNEAGKIKKNNIL